MPGEHVLAVVPMVGTGTYDDPRRPMFAPAPNQLTDSVSRKQRPSIQLFHYELSDDGQFAITEFVSGREGGLKALKQSGLSGVRLFDASKLGSADIEKQLRKFKNDFDLARFLGGASQPNTPSVAAGAQ